MAMPPRISRAGERDGHRPAIGAVAHVMIHGGSLLGGQLVDARGHHRGERGTVRPASGDQEIADRIAESFLGPVDQDRCVPGVDAEDGSATSGVVSC